MVNKLMNNDVYIFAQVFRINHLMLTIHNIQPLPNQKLSVKNIILLI